MSRKIYILSLDVLLSSENCTKQFGRDNEVVIPMEVYEAAKSYHKIPERKRILKGLFHYMESALNSRDLFGEGAIQDDGSYLRIANKVSTISDSIEKRFSLKSTLEKSVYQICIEIMESNPDDEVILISKESYIRMEANSLGIDVEDFEEDVFPKVSEQYTARNKIYISKKDIDLFYETGVLSIDSVYESEKIKWYPNLFLEIKCYDSTASALGRFDGQNIVKLYYGIDSHPYGITAKNVGQKFLLEALLTSWEKAPLVIVKGNAGTGKTYCALAAALQKYDEDFNTEINISVPTVRVGQEDLGALPGDLRKKYKPYIGGIMKNLSKLVNPEKVRYEKDSIKNSEEGEYYISKGIIKIQPIGFLRGLSLENSFFIIDEVQNIPPEDIKTIITRADIGSKFVLLGDVTQIDNPNLNERYNGLTYISEKMKGKDLCWQVSFFESDDVVRSPLCKLAVDVL